MEKALVLVGMSSAETAREFCTGIRSMLTNKHDIPVKWGSNYAFQTPHVEVHFIYDTRIQNLHGLRADAVFGMDEYREPLYPYAKPGVPKTPKVGLRDWIVEYEREARTKELLAKNALNSVYGKDGISASERLAQAAAKASAAFALASSPFKNLLDEYRKENENMSIPPYVMALANHQGPATIHAGGLSIPVKIMDIDSENHPFKHSETSLRCMVVNEHDIMHVPSPSEFMNAILNRRLAEKKAESDRFAIKRVKLGKAPAIYWENGDKTSIVGPEWYCHSEVHAMAVLFNLRRQGIAQVIFNNPVTMVRWEDGSKVTVRCQEGDVYSAQVGLDMCLAKKQLGTNKNRSNYYDVFKKWLPKDEAPVEPTVTPGPVDIEAEEAVADGE